MTHNSQVQSRRVKHVMSKDVVYVDLADTVHEAINLMVENRVAALPVLDGRGHCVGMFSTSDLLEIAREVNEDLLLLDEISSLSGGWLVEKLKQGLGESRIEELMTSGVETIDSEATVSHAARELMRHHVHRLPVVDKSGRLLGIISTMDIVAALAEIAPAE